MADLFCTFLDFRSLTINYKLHLFLPSSKHYYSSALHSHKSRISRVKRKPFHLTPLSKPSSSSDLDIISTHEHSDGSLLFRFGDPSEVAKNVKMEESKSIKDEIEGEDEDGTSVKKVADGDNVTDVMTEKAEIEVTGSGLTEVTDHTIGSKTIALVDERTESYEKLLDDSKDMELPVLTANKEMEGISTRDVDIKHIDNMEEGVNQECENFSPVESSILDESFKVESNIVTVESSEKQTADVTSTSKEMEAREQTENVENDLNEEYEDSSINASILDKSPEVVNNVIRVALPDEETADITSSPDIDIEQSGNVEEGLNEEYEDSPVDRSSEIVNNMTAVAPSEKETGHITVTPDSDIKHAGDLEEGLNDEHVDSPSNTSILDEGSKMSNNITTAALLEKETTDITSAPDIDLEHTGNVVEGLYEVHEQSSSVNASTPDISPEVENNTTSPEFLEKETAKVTLMSDPIIAVPDNDVLQGSLETVITTDVSAVFEPQNVETEMQNETIADDNESFDSNLVSPSPQAEPAIRLSKEIEEQNLQAQMQKVATEKGSESDMKNIEALEIQNAIGNGNTSDISFAEAKSFPTEAATNWSKGSEDQASGAGTGVPNETVGYIIEEDIIQLTTVPPQLEADSVVKEETSIAIMGGSMEDAESEDLTVAGDLVEASVHEATVTESTPMSQEMIMTDFVLSSGAALLPHPSKALTGGEDAYFIAGQTWLGVADGVGQWSLEGTNPGVYAQELIKNCEQLISDCNGNSIKNPVELLNLSVAKTHLPGSSTVLIAQFDGQALHVANVGDSGFVVLRDGVVYKRSSSMHHVFLFPVLIESGDDPSSLAEFYRVDLEENDVIITATDGLLDNLYDQEISSIVMKSLAGDKKPEEIAELLVRKAQEIGSSASVRSPFADDAQAAGFAGFTGGKLDDVAVIVSVVQKQSHTQT